MTLNEFAEYLLIDVDLVGDMMPLMVIGEDYEKIENVSGVKNKHIFNQLAVNKGKVYLQQLVSEREKINRVVGKLGYNIKQRHHPNIWIAYGCYTYLKGKGYKDPSIAYIMNKHRTTILTVWDRMQPLKRDIIANTVMEKTIEVLECA